MSKKISKLLSYVLRHRPDEYGLTLSADGWVAVDELLAALNSRGKGVSLDTLKHVVAENDKQRFAFNEDGSLIRAQQGHSVDVDLQYEPQSPPDVLYHGTVERFLDSIHQQGLLKGARHHVHLSADTPTALNVGSRRGKPVLLEVDARQMADDGFAFFRTGNGVWLVDHVPPKYLRKSSP